MRRQVFWALLAVLLALPAVSVAKSGFYFGFSFGGAIVNGERGISLANENLDPDLSAVVAAGHQVDKAALFSTDEGDGFAANFRLGYNILGFVAIELEIGGSGNNLGDGSKIEGQLGVFGLVRLFPAQIFPDVADRWWDPYLFIGGGGYAILYNPQDTEVHPTRSGMINDGRGWWPSGALKYGVGCDFYATKFLSLGVDLAFINGFHDKYIIDNSNGIFTEPNQTATSFVFQPTAKLTFHFGGD